MKIRPSAPGLTLAFCVAVIWNVAMTAPTANAQSAVLAEVYGRGVHAYHSGRYADSYEYLSMAINAGLQNPLAYYFRGLAADASGRQYEAEADFQAGADLEARGSYSHEIGQALVRVQGPLRLQMESIREKARLQALATSNTRSQIRYGELGAQPLAPPRVPSSPAIVVPGAAPQVPTPPPAPLAEDPFADDIGAEPTVESNDAFADAEKNPLAKPNAGADGTAPAAPAAGGDDLFSPPADSAADPFTTPADAADPFSAPPAGDDPFGGSPF